MTLSLFLQSLFDFADKENILLCPEAHTPDIASDNKPSSTKTYQFIVSHEDYERVIEFLQTAEQWSVTHLSRRYDQTYLYIMDQQKMVYRVTLIHRLCWRGIPYLYSDAVVERRHAYESFYRPNPLDELLIAFFNQLINAGTIKKGTWTKWQEITRSMPEGVKRKFCRCFGLEAGAQIANALIQGRQGILYEHLNRWRWAFLTQQWQKEGMSLVAWTGGYFKKEIAWWLTPRKNYHIVFYSTNRSSTENLIGTLKETLSENIDRIEERSIKTNNDKKAPLTPLKALGFFLSGWAAYLRPAQTSTLFLCDACLHDLSIVPEAYGYKGSRKFLSLLSRLSPKPDVMIYLSASPEVVHGSQDSHSLEDIKKQESAYRQKMALFSSRLELDSHETLESLTSQASEKILKILSDKHGKV